jgi:hypothetical protein
MKSNIKCTIYKLLFRVVPLDNWRVFLMERHFFDCPLCKEELLQEEEIKPLVVSLNDAGTLPQAWPSLQRKLEKGEPVPAAQTVIDLQRSISKRRRRLVYAVSAAIVLLVLIFAPSGDEIHILNRSESGGEPNRKTEQIVVRSVKIGSKDARYFIFHSKDPDKLIVWTEAKKNEQN